MKECTNSNLWINPIVFFCGADEINISNDENVWFDDFIDLVSYIQKDGRPSNPHEIYKCFNKATEVDFLYAPSIYGERSLHCVISFKSLNIVCNDGFAINKQMIRKIDVQHHFSCDTMEITLNSGKTKLATAENMQICVKADGNTSIYSLAKISTIIIGR